MDYICYYISFENICKNVRKKLIFTKYAKLSLNFQRNQKIFLHEVSHVLRHVMKFCSVEWHHIRPGTHLMSISKLKNMYMSYLT